VLLAASLAAAGGVSIEVETPGDGRPHRVIVTGLDEKASRVLRQADAAERALAVYTGDRVPGPDRPAVAGTHAIDESGLWFQPRFPFVPGLRYTARFLLGTVQVDRTFEVTPPAVSDPPRVLFIHPSGDTLPENALRLYVQFSHPMMARGAQQHVHLMDGGGQEVPLAFVPVEDGLWDPQRTRLTLLFHPGRVKRGVAPGERLGPPLRAGGEYRLVVDGDITDVAGTAMGQAHEHRFHVVEADRVSPRLGDARVAAPSPTSAALVVTFPEPLDHALLQRWVWVEDDDGRALAGRAEISTGETRWTFHPEKPWIPGRYVVRLRAALEDRAGNRFDRLFDRESAAPPAADVPSDVLSLPFDVPAH
jgi:hypothetical protein